MDAYTHLPLFIFLSQLTCSWKETKNFANGCSAHITGSSYAKGNVALPDQATFIIEDTHFGNSVSLEASHHCGVGSTGGLCQPQYIFDNVEWTNTDNSKKWIWFQHDNFQSHNYNQNYGGIFTLAPPDANMVMNGQPYENSIFPQGFVSLVSSEYKYLLNLPDEPCIMSSSISSEFGRLYDNGILCRVPLRSLKVWSRGLDPWATPPALKVEIWYARGGVDSQVSSPDSSQLIAFHQIGSNSPKQGFSLPVIPGVEHSYQLSLTTGNGQIPSDWIVEFSDTVMGNRYSVEYTNLSLNGRRCGLNGLVTSQHDRSFIWSGGEFLKDEAWGYAGACSLQGTSDIPIIDCNSIQNGVLQAEECPEKCGFTCNQNTYCDCGSETCEPRQGYVEELDIDLCEAARCEHGSCTAKFLGGSLPVTSKACVCDEGWSGPLCQYNPCATLGKTCSGHGSCIALSDTTAKCECDQGFSGDNCEVSCGEICDGEWPYGCARNLDGIERYGCKDASCFYLQENEDYPVEDVCTYKDDRQAGCVCDDHNDCLFTLPCNSDGSCPPSEYVPDFTPCNSVPFGLCQSGVCQEQTTISTPTNEVSQKGYIASLRMQLFLQNIKSNLTPFRICLIYIQKPTGILTNQPTHLPTSQPTNQPTPTLEPSYCGCSLCTQEVWDTLACDDNLGGCHTCGSRISWVESNNGGNMNEACTTVSEQFSSGPCGVCHPYTCNTTEAPSKSPSPAPTPAPSHEPSPLPSQHPSTSPTPQPSSSPSSSPTNVPTSKPTETPTNAPSEVPTQEPTSYCGCASCTQEIWDTLACDDNLGGCHTCGSRISWVESNNGGNTNEACTTVSEQFSSGPCGVCDPDTCNTDSPSKGPSNAPTNQPTHLPTSQPTNQPTPTLEPSYCSCSLCTQEVWDTLACDDNLGGCHTCGSRISWIESNNGGNMNEACTTVSEQFSSGPCGVCNPATCNEITLDEPDPLKLIWSDEFDVDGPPDSSKWDYDIGDGCDRGICGWGNNELQYYTSNNAVVESGVLRISAKKESIGGRDYSSARLVTRGMHYFRYGRIQFRARTAGCTARGTWSALWLLPEEWKYGSWPNSGEIDVMEAVGYQENTFHGTVHTGAFNHIIGTEETGSVTKSEADWHTFEIDWRVDKILFAIDGEVYFTFAPDNLNDTAEWPFDQDFHLLLNIAVGGNWGGVDGVDSIAFEGAGQYMELDWVRVYSS